MKTTLKINFIAAMVVLFSVSVQAQNIVINKSDVKRYLNTSRSILEERNALDMQIQTLKEPTEAKIAELKKQIKDKPKAYGWGIHYDKKIEAISEIFNGLDAMNQAKLTSDDSRDQRVAKAQKIIDQLITKFGQKSVTAVERQYIEIDQIKKGLI